MIGGFSQGAAMSYATALARPRPRPAGIVAMSGFVPRVDGFELDPAARAGLPVFISHGTYDGVIPVDFGREARRALQAAGLAVSYREDPVDHTIAPGALADARAAVAKMLS